MSTVTTSRKIDIMALPFEAVVRGSGGTWTVEADVTQSVLQAAVDAAPDDPAPVREANRAAMLVQVADSLTVLRTSIDTLQLITDKTNATIGPADTKAVARECRRVARQVVALSRLFVGSLDSTDTGAP